MLSVSKLIELQLCYYADYRKTTKKEELFYHHGQHSSGILWTQYLIFSLYVIVKMIMHITSVLILLLKL